jgi:hypothetical protein
MMDRKLTHKADKVWLSLRSLILPIEDNKTYDLLDAVKHWIEKNQRILSTDFAKGCPALLLLLEGKASQFPIYRPLEAAQKMKYLVLSLPIPESVEAMAERLETAISEFAIFSEWQECPVCQEGFLGYWIEPQTKTLVLRCPECPWEQDISGKKWVETSALLPASVEELGMQSTQTGEGNP